MPDVLVRRLTLSFNAPNVTREGTIKPSFKLFKHYGCHQVGRPFNSNRVRLLHFIVETLWQCHYASYIHTRTPLCNVACRDLC